MRSTAGRADDADRGRGRIRLTSAGLSWVGVTILLGGIGWYKSLNVVMILANIMAVLLVLNGILARWNVQNITVKRVAVPPVFAGEETRLDVLVENVGTRAATANVVDPIGPPGGWFLDQLPPGERAVCSVRRAFPTRGRSASVRLQTWSSFPFGFVRCERTLAKSEADAIVLPALGVANAEALRRWIQRHAMGEGRARKVLRRVTSDQADVRGVRPYRPGDSIRSIHWRSTARRRELLVCEYDTAPSPELLVVFEPWLPVNPNEDAIDNLESQLSLTATVIWSWSRAFSTKVTLVIAANDEQSAWSATGGEQFTREMLIPLADLAGTATPRVPTAFDRSIQGAARLLITTRTHSPLAAQLSSATGRPFVVLGPDQSLPWYQAPVIEVGDAIDATESR